MPRDALSNEFFEKKPYETSLTSRQGTYAISRNWELTFNRTMSSLRFRQKLLLFFMPFTVLSVFAPGTALALRTCKEFIVVQRHFLKDFYIPRSCNFAFHRSRQLLSSSLLASVHRLYQLYAYE